VSVLYSQIFDVNVIVDPDFSESAMQKDLKRRTNSKTPPGYKDASKEDEGVGDLLIWHTILHIGKECECDLVLITGDQKSDWWHRSGNEAIYPRHELVDEYRRISGGCSFHMMSFSKLLDLSGASREAIEAVRLEEEEQTESLPTNNSDLAMLRKIWPEIRKRVKAINRRFEALLASVEPIEIWGNCVVLGANYRFHEIRLNEPEVRAVVEDAIGQLLRIPVNVSTVLIGSELNTIPTEWDDVPF